MSELGITNTAFLAGLIGYGFVQATNFLGKQLTKSTSSQEVLDLPEINLASLFNQEANPEEFKAECAKVAEAFHKYGVCIIRDPRGLVCLSILVSLLW